MRFILPTSTSLEWLPGKFIATLPKSQKLLFRLRDSCKDVNRKNPIPAINFCYRRLLVLNNRSGLPPPVKNEEPTGDAEQNGEGRRHFYFKRPDGRYLPGGNEGGSE